MEQKQILKILMEPRRNTNGTPQLINLQLVILVIPSIPTVPPIKKRKRIWGILENKNRNIVPYSPNAYTCIRVRA